MAFCNKKVVQASYHQGDIIRYERDSTGKQCMANVYLPWFLHQLRVSLWKSFDFDYVLEQRDKNFKKVCENKKKAWILAVDELLLNFPLEGTNVSARKLAHDSLLFAEKNNFFENYRHYSESEREWDNSHMWWIHGHLKKQSEPPQAVWNKLDIVSPQ